MSPLPSCAQLPPLQVFGGGPVLTANPEPYAAFFDVVLLGDGEDLLASFTQAVQDIRSAGGGSRLERLLALAAVPGVYVPSLYRPTYDGPEGGLLGIEAAHAGIPAFVQKQTYRGGTLASSTVVSPRMAWESIYMAEVVRSCPEMCRFCLASYLTLPFRPAPLEGALIPAIQRGLEVTDRIGLLGAPVREWGCVCLHFPWAAWVRPRPACQERCAGGRLA